MTDFGVLSKAELFGNGNGQINFVDSRVEMLFWCIRQSVPFFHVHIPDIITLVVFNDIIASVVVILGESSKTSAVFKFHVLYHPVVDDHYVFLKKPQLYSKIKMK